MLGWYGRVNNNLYMKTGIYLILGGLVAILTGFFLISKDKESQPYKAPVKRSQEPVTDAILEVEEVKEKEEDHEIVS
jgi:hypothetical protein